MVWMPVSDNDPLKKVSDEWFDRLPTHVGEALVSLAKRRSLSLPALLGQLAIQHQLTLAKAALPTAEDVKDIARVLGLLPKDRAREEEEQAKLNGEALEWMLNRARNSKG